MDDYYGIRPRVGETEEERKEKIEKIKKMRKAHSDIQNVLIENELTYNDMNRLFKKIVNEADSSLWNSKLTFKVQK